MKLSLSSLSALLVGSLCLLMFLLWASSLLVLAERHNEQTSSTLQQNLHAQVLQLQQNQQLWLQSQYYLLNTLAKGDIHVASYYLRRGAYVAAVNRAKSVLTNYPQTPQTRDALQIMVQAYEAMGMNDLSDDAKKILDLNVAKDGIKPIVREMPDTTPWWDFWS